MRVAILGFGLQGKSSYDYFSLDPKNEITICDRESDTEIPTGIKVSTGEDYLKNLDEFDVIVRSPSVRPSEIIKANNPAILEKVTTNTNEFFRVCPSKNIIGITGTKGKGTTSTLITKMLEADGKKVRLGGNIGTPPLDMLEQIQPEDWVVLELANFQLIDIDYSPPLAVCLMVVDEHLDWHKDSGEYIAAKQQLFRWQKPDDTAIYYADNPVSRHIAEASPATLIPYMKQPGADVVANKIVIGSQEICDVKDVKLLGSHNLQNVCAAVTAVWQITQNVEAIRSVATTFSGLEHRLELVREVDSVRYYDDSFGTTPETAIVAIEAFSQPKIAILGGSDKGAQYDELAQTVTENDVKHVLLIGEIAPEIQVKLEKVGYRNFSEGGNSMTEIVNKARQLASPGDVVLLSPAAASFDMFENYKDRGEQFKKCVQALA